MEAKDLMIGDYVYNHRNWECPIVEIHKNSAIVIARHYGEEEFLLSDLRPIPLTTEILEKNGFVENRGFTSWKFETDRGDLIDIYGVNEYHLSINIEDTHGSGKGYRWMLDNLTIFYVHQLQHALRLCGITKEIEL